MAEPEKVAEAGTKLGTRLIARFRKRIEADLAYDPELRDHVLADFDAKAGKIDPNNLAAILKFLGDMLALLLPIFIHK